MKLKSILSILSGFLVYAALHCIVFGYENTISHPSLNGAFVQYLEDLLAKEQPTEIYFELSDKVYNRLKGPGITNRGFFDNTTGESILDLSPKDWIKHGGMSADEPEIAAAVRHFYDPLGLHGGNKYLTNRGTYWEGVYSNPGIDAIEWAFGDTEKGSANKWSFKAGKDYFVKALQEKDETKRNEYMAKAWRCLGETLHNTADMACPPHVRNDSHAAPFGWTGGWVMGSPDPYEEMFSTSWVEKYFNGEPDPGFLASIQDLETARTINEKLAAFTNANFFSNETISGMGVKLIKSSNGEKDYPSPKLENLTYQEDDFTFYKTFPSGRTVKMCKDHSYFNFRGYPFIDRSCAESQASELLPNFKAAALRVYLLFIPDMFLRIDQISDKGLITGVVSHSENNKEYPNPILYNGTVNVFVGSKLVKCNCVNGNWEGQLNPADLTSSTIVKAKIEVGGVTFISSEVKSFDFSKFKKFTFESDFEAFDESGNKKSFNIQFAPVSTDPYINWITNNFTYNIAKTSTTEDNSQTLTMKFDDVGGMNYEILVKSLRYEASKNIKSEKDGFKLYDKTDYIIEFKNKTNYELPSFFKSDVAAQIDLSSTEIKKTLSTFSIINTKTVPVYDGKGKISKVNVVTTKYLNYNHNNTFAFFQVILKGK